MTWRKGLLLAALAVGALATGSEAAEPRTLGPLGLIGGKYQAPQTRMSQAGVAWPISNHVSLHLSYERTGYAPIMRFDHDDGIMTGVKIGF
jgi:hypothetical protein